jgi:putative nucleotidyltransferase with HDIG domain
MVCTSVNEAILPHLSAIIAIAAAVLITVGSAYWSRVALPRQIDRAYRASLYALAAAVETKDSSAAGHAKRVADYAVAIARDIGVSSGELQRIEHSALLRDIGKVNLASSALNKAEPLTAEEFELIKSHVSLGADMVSQAPFLERCANIILHHHERWNGSGYPDGLSEEEIPLGARIVAVADDYEAMTSDRPYHEALPRSQAIEIVKEGSGTKYDPSVVEAFLRIIERERLNTV